MSIDISNLCELTVPDDAREITRECLSLLVEHLRTEDDECSITFRSLPGLKQLIILNDVARSTYQRDLFTMPFEIEYNMESSDPRSAYQSLLMAVQTRMKYFNRMFRKTPKKKAGGLRLLAMTNSVTRSPIDLREMAFREPRALQEIGAE